MKKNFEVGQSNELLTEKGCYDLHNMYDYVGVILRNNNREAQILFSPSAIEVKKIPSISLSFFGVTYFELSENFGAQTIFDVDEIGYKSENDHDDEWLLNEKQASDQDHLFIRLENLNFIRIGSDAAELVEVEKPKSVK